jgi:hypothetical protein
MSNRLIQVKRGGGKYIQDYLTDMGTRRKDNPMFFFMLFPNIIIILVAKVPHPSPDSRN